MTSSNPAEDGGVSIAPRGTRRVHFISDPSSITMNVLPDPVEIDDLRRLVDMIADSGADSFQQDVYNKGCTAYWHSDEFQYDGREQHKRFLPMLEAGTQPLQVLLDHSHMRGMAFTAGFRMNDTHGGEHFPVRADFVESHPEWQFQDSREDGGYHEGFPLDFTFDEVRDYVFRVMQEVVSRFDVDGIEMTFRDPIYFPFPEGRPRAHLMTSLVSRLRDMLDGFSKTRGRRIQLGARVFSTLDECLDMGLDAPTWIAEGLLDYVSPMDTMFCDFNAEYEEFAGLTRDTSCMLYPTLNQWTSRRPSSRKPCRCSTNCATRTESPAATGTMSSIPPGRGRATSAGTVLDRCHKGVPCCPRARRGKGVGGISFSPVRAHGPRPAGDAVDTGQPYRAR